jgi:hypothetical protein
MKVYHAHRIHPNVSATHVAIFREIRCKEYTHREILQKFLKPMHLCTGYKNFCNISMYVFFETNASVH